MVRETLEETRLEVRVVRLLNVYSYRDSPTVVVAYLTEYLAGELAAGDETLEARVFDLAGDPLGRDSFPLHPGGLNRISAAAGLIAAYQ